MAMFNSYVSLPEGMISIDSTCRTHMLTIVDLVFFRSADWGPLSWLRTHCAAGRMSMDLIVSSIWDMVEPEVVGHPLPVNAGGFLG